MSAEGVVEKERVRESKREREIERVGGAEKDTHVHSERQTLTVC